MVMISILDTVHKENRSYQLLRKQYDKYNKVRYFAKVYDYTNEMNITTLFSKIVNYYEDTETLADSICEYFYVAIKRFETKKELEATNESTTVHTTW